MAQLQELLMDAPRAKPDAPPPVAARPGLAAAGCELCRGACCTGGGNHAYLRPGTLLRAARASGFGLETLAELYRAAIPALVIEDSCLFHAADGCALPAVMRSEVCNGHWCGPLKRALAAPDPGETILVVMKGAEVLRTKNSL